MNKAARRMAVAALAGIMAAGLLSGCGEKKLDGAKTVATVDGEEISLGLVSLLARQQQAQTDAMYRSFMGTGANIWDQAVSEDGELTYGDQLVEEAFKSGETMYLSRAKAADYGVEFTEEDKKAVEEAAAEFMKANSEETLAELAVTEDQVKTYLELQTYGQRVMEALYEEAPVEVTDEEAQQSSFSYVSISKSDTSLTEEELAKIDENAQKILDSVKAEPTKDMDELAKAVDETYAGLNGNFTTKDGEDVTYAYPDEVIEALRTLKDGEVYPELVEAENTLYILRLDETLDKEATESKKASMESQQQMDYYAETITQWTEDADIQVQEDVLKTLTVTDSHTFTIATEDMSEDTSAEDAEEVPEEMENAPVIDEDMDDAQLIEDDIENALVVDEEGNVISEPEEDAAAEEEDMTPVEGMDEDLEPAENVEE